MMRLTFAGSIFFSLCLLSSCNLLNRLENRGETLNQKKDIMVTGSREFVNNATESEWIDLKLTMDDDLVEELGVAPGTSKTLGFAQIKIGSRLEIQWKERYAHGKVKIYKKQIVRFDTRKLLDVASKVKGMQFIYSGKGKWKLRVYSDRRFKEEHFLTEVTAQGTDLPPSNPTNL